MPSKQKSDMSVAGRAGPSDPANPSASPSPAGIRGPDLRKLLESQEFRCALTGRLLTPQTASFDYKLPLSHGGVNAIENGQILDCRVNAAKGSLTLEEFIQLCREVVAWKESHPDA